jgi:hypothetical protein
MPLSGASPAVASLCSLLVASFDIVPRGHAIAG